MTDRSNTAARARRRLAAAAVASTLVAGGVLATHLSPTTAATGTTKLTREQVARALLERREEFLSPGAAAYLRYVTGENRRTGLVGEKDAPTGVAKAAAGTASRTGSAGAANVRVNDPRKDRFLDQTTQSETALAVSGRHVVVGFNDSQHVYPGGVFTAAANLTGYAFSDDGGRSFTDGGTLPSAPGQIHFGDPWLGADRAGNFYFSDLSVSGESGSLEVAVATSHDGGTSWSGPAFASPNDPNIFYSADKDALAVGRSKADPAKDTVYVAWDDFGDDGQGNGFSGLPVARSEDGGRTFQLAYADKFTFTDPNSCSFGQYIGSTPSVDAATGDLLVTSLQIAVDDPTCAGTGTETFKIVAVSSKDGGRTFGKPVTVGTVGDFFDIDLGPGSSARSLPLPAITRDGARTVIAWNEGAQGASRILWSSSANGGKTWTVPATVPAADGEDFQPALSADASGVHLAYYHKSPDDMIDVLLADSTHGGAWTTKRVTTKPFPGVFNDPQFDPVIATGYMGDYIANTASGGHVYLSWGDNRDVVRNALWPDGRNDPDVFFARR